MLNMLRRTNRNKVNKSITSINEYIDQLEKDNERLTDRLQNINKDDEIQKYKDQAYNTFNNSLLQLSDIEKERIVAFKKKHYEECGNGNDFEYRLIGTGFDTDIIIRCPKCMDVENVTDTGSW